jgi:hypothetical protein
MFNIDRAQHSSLGFIGDLLQERRLSLVWFSESESPVSYRPIVVFVAHSQSVCSSEPTRNESRLLS